MDTIVLDCEHAVKDTDLIHESACLVPLILELKMTICIVLSCFFVSCIFQILNNSVNSFSYEL